MNLYQFRYYSDTYNVPLRNLNIAFVVLQLFLFVGDPLLGWYTDTAHTRWGRRRPFIGLFGPALMVIVFLGMYPIFDSSQVVLTIWFGTSYMLNNLVTLLYLSPYQALGIELTLDSRERNKLFGVTQTLYQLGVVVSTALPEAMVALHPERREVYMWFGATAGALGVITMLTLVVFVKERSDFVVETPTPLIAGMIRTLQNPAFATLLVTITLLNCQPYYLVILPYWVKYSLQLDSFWQAAIMTTYMTGAFVFIPFWTWLSSRTGKKKTYLISMAVAIIAFSAIVLVKPGQKAAAIAVSFCAGASGLSLNAYNFLFQSLLADIIEYDELRTGVRREAQYANMVQVFNALTSVMSVSLPLFIMDSVGFHANETQDDKVRTTISLLLGPGCAAYVLLAAISFMFYPITTLVHERIREGLLMHASGKPALDPVTKEMVLAPGAATSVVPASDAWFLDNFFGFELSFALLRDGSSRVAPLGLIKLVVFWLVLTAGTTTGSIIWIFQDPSRYLEVGSFIAMCSLAVFIFNLCRISPALKFAKSPLPHAIVYHHVLHGNNLVANQ